MAVLRLPSGRQVRGNLHVISVTGGLLCLPCPLGQDSPVKLMFRTETGLVLGTAEMLSPISRTLQPFRFIAIAEDDRLKLSDAIRSSAHQNRLEQQSIIRDRAW